MPNRLARETSPYLLQHAENPVDWYPWGEEALMLARSEDKPVLLSIGYSACHWCHVMAHECFENSNIANLMNKYFVNIKVDREEHPELDSIYMEAVQAMTGSGGWPLTVFLTPEAKPFFGGTYFPPEDRHGMLGFPRVLQSVVEAYRHHRGDIEQTAGEVASVLSRRNASSNDNAVPLTIGILKQAYAAMTQNFDSDNGGFGGAPKFPQPKALEFLMRYAHRFADSTALDMVGLTLEKMCRGGIYDQIGGGFHRYATDESWIVPHFEKMLYDNAQLSHLYLQAYLFTAKPVYRSIVEQTLDYVLREMTAPDGGFYSTQDADSEGIEGKYYGWEDQEITEVLGKDTGRMISSYFGITPEGNFDGRNILHVADDASADASIIKLAKTALFNKREHRVKPGLDEKIQASWNGLMLASMAEAACALRRQDYLAAAIADGSFLLRSMIVDGNLRHYYKDGKVSEDGYLQDYAMVIEGFLVLHQATLHGEWLNQAIRLAETMVEKFWDKQSNMFFDTVAAQRDLFIRPRSFFDEALPSGSSTAASVLLRLARITDNELWQQVAVQSLRLVADLMRQYPLGLSNWLCALDFYLSSPKEIVVVGQKNDAATLNLLSAVCSTWIPNKVVVGYDAGEIVPLSGLKLLEGKQMVGGRPTVYVCQGCACKQPVTDAALLGNLLK